MGLKVPSLEQFCFLIFFVLLFTLLLEVICPVLKYLGSSEVFVGV